MTIERVRQMLVKEFIHILRDPRMRGVVFIVPILQVLVFGYVVTTDVNHVPTGVHDLDNSQASRELVDRFVRSGYFDVAAVVREESEIRELLDRGRVSVVLRVPKGFEQAVRSGRKARLQMLLDGTDSNTARIVLDYGVRIAGEYSEAIRVSRVERQGRPLRASGVQLRSRAWFNDNLESRNYYVPGVIAMLVMLITLLMTSMAVVREREIGTMEQILVTPITPVEFILGKTLPFALIGVVDVILITLAGVFWFEVPVRGNLALLFFATALYLMTTLGIGLLISTVSRTQQQAMMTTFFFYFPAVLLSGFLFPIANMPAVIQWITCLNPFRHFLVIIRGVFLKGVGLPVLWPQMAALAVLGVLTLRVAVGRFHKTLA